MRIYNDQVNELMGDLPQAERVETSSLPPLFPESYLTKAQFQKNLATRPPSPIVISSDSDCTDY